MGFGIAFIGYCFLFLHQAGLGVVGVPMLAYGFFLAGRLHRYFFGAAFSALLMLPRAVLILLDVFLPVIGKDFKIATQYPILNLVTYLLFLIAWLSMIFWHCTAVRQIAKENGADKLEKQAGRRLYISAVVIALALSLVVLQQIVSEQAIVLITYLAIYVVMLLQILFTHTCFVLITSEKQYAEDKRYVMEQNREAAERKERDRKRFGGDEGSGSPKQSGKKKKKK